ncbi:FecR domain-containing protein [Sphingomonas sp. BIUV-7]|uniref:FecR domain-containing protein n=1 Tax=Sphingomonas natans TaxID=3063330 RepID=A0ABT8YA96_9SPHN|nr:FecR domain-containing protein [Sphingomonas sp. BIUV-7]MDO6414629.1 FecR domain-containing protein [Sphingomonas sp. BIUV-7]
MSGISGSNMRDDAVAWVARMDAGGWSAELEAELQAWLAGEPRRHGALLQAQATWSMLARKCGPHSQSPKARIAGQDDVATDPAPDRAVLNRRALMVGGGTALAASLVGGITLIKQRTVLRTDLGEIRHVPLDDGSIAALNTGSEVDVMFGSARRDIRLNQGEAWFQVAKNRAKPFVVETGPIRVLAIGTAFSVRRREAGADIAVTEGIVEIWSEDAGSQRTRLVEGQSVFLADNARLQDVVVASASGEHALAWRSGRIELVDEMLVDAISEFNRYNRRRIILLDPQIANKRLDGFFRTDDIDGFARAVNATFDVPVDFSRPDEIRIGSMQITT